MFGQQTIESARDYGSDCRNLIVNMLYNLWIDSPKQQYTGKKNIGPFAIHLNDDVDRIYVQCGFLKLNILLTSARRMCIKLINNILSF